MILFYFLYILKNIAWCNINMLKIILNSIKCVLKLNCITYVIVFLFNCKVILKLKKEKNEERFITYFQIDLYFRIITLFHHFLPWYSTQRIWCNRRIPDHTRITSRCRGHYITRLPLVVCTSSRTVSVHNNLRKTNLQHQHM